VQPVWLSDNAASLVAYGNVAAPKPPSGMELKPPPEPEEDPMWKEKFEESERERQFLAGRVEALQQKIEELILRPTADLARLAQNGSSAQSESLPQIERSPRLEKADFILPGFTVEKIYTAVKERAAKDPGVLELLTQQPEIRVKIQRTTLQLTTDNLQGKLAKLIAEGFFDGSANANQAFMELKRRGDSVSVPNVYRELDGLTALGFLTKERNGKQTAYQRVPGMKVSKSTIETSGD
jgi:hypothetical protein